MNRHMDSFDHWTTATRAYKGWTFSVAGASPGDEGCTIGPYGRRGSNGLRCRNGAVSGVAGRATRGVTTSGATAIKGVAFRVNTAIPSVDFALCSFLRGSTELITVTCSATGTLSVRLGGRTGSVLSTSVSTITHSTFYFLEPKVVLNASTGLYELRVNGTNFTSNPSVNTLISGAATWDGIALGGTNVGANFSIDFDDIYVFDGSTGADNDFAGDHPIEWRPMSSGNGTRTGWSPSVGSDHGALVGESTPDVSTFNQAGTVGARDTYNVAALGVAGTVRAVQTVNLLKADVAGLRTVVPSFYIGGTDYDGNGAVLGSDWSYQLEIHPTDPSTVAPWTISGIDAAEFGVAVTA
jgi:hypothetical protein